MEEPDDVEKRLNALEKNFKDKIEELGNENSLLSQANIDLILIEMHSIASNLSYAEELLRKIGTLKQFENLREVEKNVGVNMAFTTSKSFLEAAGSDARNVMPTLKAIKNSMDKISKKLKYTAEA